MLVKIETYVIQKGDTHTVLLQPFPLNILESFIYHMYYPILLNCSIKFHIPLYSYTNLFNQFTHLLIDVYVLLGRCHIQCFVYTNGDMLHCCTVSFFTL